MSVLDQFLFHQGTNYQAYKYMGSHLNGDGTCAFRVWAPNAKKVCVTGDFNGWSESQDFTMVSSGGIWEGNIDGVKNGDKYKYVIYTSARKKVLKCDPYANFNEHQLGQASIVWNIDGYSWNDSEFVSRRSGDYYSKPMNIYEVNIASWKLNADGSFYTYRQLADTLLPYVVEMGYTHIEFMPLTEFPFEGSWGYQVTGYFAPTSRFGEPADLMYLVDKCHQSNVGVILDWVPAHFPKDSHGLYMFDGKPLYEYADVNKQEHKSWGTVVFDYGRNEVQSFLVSSAVMFLSEYHFDGLRVDAVASMLYLDYDRTEFTPNANGGRENLEAIAFFKKLSGVVNTFCPNVLLIAEESTAFPLVTMPTDVGGLGFNLKWNMGWMNDTLSYYITDPLYRQYKHDKLTFPACYAFSESFILPFSHDEVVHGKKSLLDKYNGEYADKFASLRQLMTYQICQVGKKLNFMGNEFGQFIEWNYKQQLDWLLLKYPSHAAMQRFVRELNHFYLDNNALWQRERGWDGFNWIVANDNTANVIVFTRTSDSQQLMIAINFSATYHRGYTIYTGDKYNLVLNTNAAKYGGNGDKTNIKRLKGKMFVDIPPLTAMIFERNDT